MSKIYSINTHNDTALLERYPYGILSPATTNGGAQPDHFGDRLVYATSERVEVNNYSDSGANITASVVVGDGTFTRTYTPFQIEVRLKTSTLGMTPKEVGQLAKTYMDIVTQKAIEREFWTGEIATAAGFTENRFLTGTTATALTASALTGTARPKFDLGVLEQALAGCGIGEVGVIHIPHVLAMPLDLDIHKKGYPVTPAGNKVVIGSGYVAANPLTPMMVATGPVSVELGPVTKTWQKDSDAVDAATNTIEHIFTREAAVVWSNGCHFTIVTSL